MSIQNTKLIQARFSKNFATYAKTAQMQKMIAKTLWNYWQQQSCITELNRTNTVLEIGCGTGNLTQYICQLPQLKQLYLNDLCSQAKDWVTPIAENNSWQFLLGDIANIKLLEDFDAIFSASTIHWISDIPAIINKLTAKLKPGGWLCLSTFGPSQYQQIRQLTNIGLSYLNLSEWQCLLKEQFNIYVAKEQLYSQAFSTVLEMLKYMKQTGVSGIKPIVWNKTQISSFEQEYKKYFSNQNQQVILTYHPIYLIAQKRD